MRHEVKTFAQCMEHKLQKNDHKGGWEEIPNDELFRRLRDEIDELEQALNNEPTLNIAFEAADVANFAMMIAWNALRQMIVPPLKEAPSHHDKETNPDCKFPNGPCDCIPF